MIQATALVIFYAVIAAISPLVLTATFVVIRSERPRTNGIAFLTGFVLGTGIACVLGLIVGQAAVDGLDSHETVEAVLALLLGVALLGAGIRERHAPQRPQGDTGRRGAILAALAHVGPATAVSMAGLLGFGGPKRLLITFLAMAAISDARLGGLEDVALVLIYIGVATLIVSAPVGMVVVAGNRAAGLLRLGESWLATHAAALRVWLAFVVGAALVVDGLVRLVGDPPG